MTKILIVEFSIKVTSLTTHYKVDSLQWRAVWKTIITFSGENDWIKQTQKT